MKSKLKIKRHETNAVIIEYGGGIFEIYFNPNKYGKHAKKQWATLNEPIRR